MSKKINCRYKFKQKILKYLKSILKKDENLEKEKREECLNKNTELIEKLSSIHTKILEQSATKKSSNISKIKKVLK